MISLLCLMILVRYFFRPRRSTSRAIATKAKMGPRVLGWVISGSRIDKIYPETALAISRIIRELDMPVMLVGASTEKELQMAKTIEEVVQLQNGSKKNLHEAITQNHNDPGGEAPLGIAAVDLAAPDVRCRRHHRTRDWHGPRRSSRCRRS